MKRVSSLLAVAVAVACSDAFQPTIDNVAGDYTARTFTITDSTGTTDVLKAGGVLTFSLVPAARRPDISTFPAPWRAVATWSRTWWVHGPCPAASSTSAGPQTHSCATWALSPENVDWTAARSSAA